MNKKNKNLSPFRDSEEATAAVSEKGDVVHARRLRVLTIRNHQAQVQ